MAYQRRPLSDQHGPLDRLRAIEIGERAASLERVENSTWAYRFIWMSPLWWWDEASESFIRESRPRFLEKAGEWERDLRENGLLLDGIPEAAAERATRRGARPRDRRARGDPREGREQRIGVSVLVGVLLVGRVMRFYRYDEVRPALVTATGAEARDAEQRQRVKAARWRQSALRQLAARAICAAWAHDPDFTRDDCRCRRCGASWSSRFDWQRSTLTEKQRRSL